MTIYTNINYNTNNLKFIYKNIKNYKKKNYKNLIKKTTN